MAVYVTRQYQRRAGCLLCKSGCVHCEADSVWSRVQALAVLCETTVRDGAEAYGLLEDLIWDAYHGMEGLDEDDERESSAYEDYLRDYTTYTELRDEVKALVDGKALAWRRP